MVEGFKTTYKLRSHREDAWPRDTQYQRLIACALKDKSEGLRPRESMAHSMREKASAREWSQSVTRTAE